MHRGVSNQILLFSSCVIFFSDTKISIIAAGYCSHHFNDRCLYQGKEERVNSLKSFNIRRGMIRSRIISEWTGAKIVRFKFWRDIAFSIDIIRIHNITMNSRPINQITNIKPSPFHHIYPNESKNHPQDPHNQFDIHSSEHHHHPKPCLLETPNETDPYHYFKPSTHHHENPCPPSEDVNLSR